MLLAAGRVPVHPEEMLLEELLKPAGSSQYKLSKNTGMMYRRVNEIVNGRRPVTLDTAFRLARHFDMSPGFWVNLEAAWDPGTSGTLRPTRPSREASSLRPLGLHGAREGCVALLVRRASRAWDRRTHTYGESVGHPGVWAA